MANMAIIINANREGYGTDQIRNTMMIRDENRDVALREMCKYVNQNGFTVYDNDGRFTIADIMLVEKEPIVGSPVISEKSYFELFDVYGNRRKDG